MADESERHLIRNDGYSGSQKKLPEMRIARLASIQRELQEHKAAAALKDSAKLSEQKKN